jgi:hypothetical protein
LVDYIKISIKDLNPAILEANPLLDFFYKDINQETGEVRTTNHKGQTITPYKYAYHKSLEFKIYDNGNITLQGSLHKYYNSGAHNYNDFDFNAFKGVLNDLKTNFNIEPKNCIIRCIELGINIIPPTKTNYILDYCFLHKTLPFEYQINSDEGKYKQVKHSQYIIKLYNKALHYKRRGFEINNEILRFEVKYLKMERLNKLGVYNLNDIVEVGFNHFKNELITEWSNILFYDFTINANSKRLDNYKNPLYWSELLEKTTKTNFYKQKEILKQITLNNSDKLQHKMAKIMSDKIDNLSQKGASFDTLYILSIPTPLQLEIKSLNNNICQVTGVNISMQKDNSILLSHSGLKYYFKTDKKMFEQIKRQYLTRKWQNSDFETQIKEIAHNIRNYKHNQQTKQTKIYQPQQINLLKDYNFI